jgi:hypothetical protein
MGKKKKKEKEFDPPIHGYCRMGYTKFGIHYGKFQGLKKKRESA